MTRLCKVLLVGLLLTSCSGGTGVAISYYLIDAREQTPLTEPNQLAVQIVDLHVPQYLERYQIAARSDNSRLVFSDLHQWGENLRKNLLRSLGVNLARLLNTVDISTPVMRASSRPDYRVRLYIAAFERGADGRVQLQARWQVDGGRDAMHTEGVTLASSVVSDFPETVIAMADLYSELSQQIAASILKLEREAP